MRVHRTVALTAACLVLSFTGQNQAMAADQALPVPQTGKDGMLRLTSSVYPLDIPYLGPGESFSWQVGAVLDGPDSATATLELQGSGSLSAGPDAYAITAQSCPVQWTGTSGKNATLLCSPGAKPVVAVDSFGSGGGMAYQLGRFTTADQPWVLFRLERPAGAAGADGTLAFGIGIVAGDDDGGTRPPVDLAVTGMNVLPYLAGAGGLTFAGALLVRAVRRREQQ